MHLDPPQSCPSLQLLSAAATWDHWLRKLQARPGFTWQETLPPKPEFGSRRAIEHTPIQLISSEKSEIVSQESSRFVVRVSFIRMSLLKCSRGGSKSSRESWLEPGGDQSQELSSFSTFRRVDKRNHVIAQWTNMCKYYLSGPGASITTTSSSCSTRS